ncbi:hypothetical protein Tsubulata_015177 [Turnera subulata]|uniref:Protein RIK n=1 Tax=Turnera subulata TaxID=218843 RepID=A0A9Q0J2V7_9ROSI|nr:hypothetical protein Tsubulata_015177 [Turnera subulata]
MTEDKSNRLSSEDSTPNTDASQARQRKKRKWDQPAESVAAMPGVLPLASVSGVSLPGVASFSGALLTNQYVATPATIPVVPLPQNAGVGVPKPNQLKIQEELIIAREIVINDAEPDVRYKLTKRQTQEEANPEVHWCCSDYQVSMLVKEDNRDVLGKYRPPNAPPDVEKPLYLHISAAAHLKDTTERILAVDRAAAMVDEMLKQGQGLQSSSVFSTTAGNGALSTCVFLGFDADPSLNITARIRGPNDQYINHIMNETGATVILRGHGSGNFDSPNSGEAQQPLHLFLSASNFKSLEDAKRLAENLLDTISLECGASRVSSTKLYKAVPPPQDLGGVQSLVNEHKVNTSSAAGLQTSTIGSTPSIPLSSVTVPGVPTVFSHGTIPQPGGLVNPTQLQPNSAGYSQPFVTRGTSYSGYGGIYPQATPLQQVALALRQSASPISSTVAPTTSVGSTAPKPSTSSVPEKGQAAKQKRKFQELPVGSVDPAKTLQVFSLTFYEANRLIADLYVRAIGFALFVSDPLQGSESTKPGEQQVEYVARNISTMPAPRKFVQPSSGMPPPPPRTTPPPPPKFTSTPATKLHDKNRLGNGTKSDSVPDTLVKLMEYGEDDEDPDETSERSHHENSSAPPLRKPFWAL